MKLTLGRSAAVVVEWKTRAAGYVRCPDPRRSSQGRLGSEKKMNRGIPFLLIRMALRLLKEMLASDASKAALLSGRAG